MATTTGKLDKLIEEKVNQKISDFSKSIINQIKDFLVENGDFRGDYLYQAQNFESSNCGSYSVPVDYRHRNIEDLRRNIKGGLELTIKSKMIDRETKALLSKIELL